MSNRRWKIEVVDLHNDRVIGRSYRETPGVIL